MYEPRILVAGADGQLGQELRLTRPAGCDVLFRGRSELNIVDSRLVREVLHGWRPRVVINAAAFTNVDAAEVEREHAFAVNAAGVRNLAEACRKLDSKLVHVSTDYVFDGRRNRPYEPQAVTSPLNVYGASKLQGEELARDVLGDKLIVVRSSWIYSKFGDNFALKMLRLISERELVRVVSDHVGSPTWARGLARFLWHVAMLGNAKGILHWADAGSASRYEFVVALREAAQTKRLLQQSAEIVPVCARAFPTPARRPGYSVLDSTTSGELTGCEIHHWREQLERMLSDFQPGSGKPES